MDAKQFAQKFVDPTIAEFERDPRSTRRAFLASRTNTLLSIPMAFFMVAAPFLFQYVAK